MWSWWPRGVCPWVVRPVAVELVFGALGKNQLGVEQICGEGRFRELGVAVQPQSGAWPRPFSALTVIFPHPDSPCQVPAWLSDDSLTVAEPVFGVSLPQFPRVRESQTVLACGNALVCCFLFYVV